MFDLIDISQQITHMKLKLNHYNSLEKKPFRLFLHCSSISPMQYIPQATEPFTLVCMSRWAAPGTAAVAGPIDIMNTNTRRGPGSVNQREESLPCMVLALYCFSYKVGSRTCF